LPEEPASALDEICPPIMPKSADLIARLPASPSPAVEDSTEASAKRISGAVRLIVPPSPVATHDPSGQAADAEEMEAPDLRSISAAVTDTPPALPAPNVDEEMLEPPSDSSRTASIWREPAKPTSPSVRPSAMPPRSAAQVGRR
jgi:hypothetical protein